MAEAPTPDAEPIATIDPKARETEDPIAALDHPKISVRAAGARDLSRFGQPDVIPLLVRKAQQDTSPAVRLGTASAAADILSRCRSGKARGSLSDAARAELLDLFKGVDPGVNAGLFPMLATLGLTREGLRRISIGLRDPRASVRVGAAVGLMRLCMSAAVAGDAELEADVVALLGDQRLKPDALSEVARVCAAVGYQSSRAAVGRLDLSGLHGEMVSQAIDVFDGYDTPLSGAWTTDGLDAGEVDPVGAQPDRLAVVSGGLLLRAEGGGWSRLATLTLSKVRRMFIRRVGQPEAAPAFQYGGTTWYALAGDSLVDAIGAAFDAEKLIFAAPSAQSARDLATAAAEALSGELPETAAGLRALAVLHLVSGDLGKARAALSEALELKKIPPDTWTLLGETLTGLGRPDEAAEHYDTAIKKSRSKRAWYAARARERLGIDD